MKDQLGSAVLTGRVLQLQDILLQREEELFQLQEENQKLREFLNSSFVKNLKLQAQVHVHHGPKLRDSHEPSLRCPLLPLSPQNASGDGRGDPTRQLKRNLAGPDEGPFQNSPWPPPQVSKRVCRNITEFSSGSPPEPNLDRWVLRMLGLKDAGAMGPSPSSCPTTCCASSSPCPDLRVSGPSRLYEDTTRPSCPTAFQSPPEGPDFRCPTAGPAWSPAEPAACDPSSPDGDHSSPPAEDVLVSPSSQQRSVCGPGRPSGRCWTPADPPADVVFSMCLSPSSSIRTHSFPQGQAFIRNNPDGRWNFTWVPRHGP